MRGGDESSVLEGLPGPGELLAGKYRLREALGVGGMGVVVAGEHVRLEQPVAVKMLLPRVALLPGARGRFVREARAAAKIPGEHVVRILDVDTTPEGIAYMIMERLEGVDLGALAAERGHLDPTAAVDIVLQGLEGVAAAHAAGVVHRDLKPSNLFLARQRDGRTVVKVLDFGISKTLSTEGDASQTLTDPNAPIGSPQYMAPEQITDGRSVDGRADIWSVGVMLYELISGQSPFEATSISHLYVKILHEQPPPLAKLRRGVPVGLSRVIEACLAKDRGARVQTVQELSAMLLPFASPRARAMLASRDDVEAPSVPAVVASLRSVAATSDADALGATIPLPAPSSRRRATLAAAAVAIVVCAIVVLGQKARSTDAAPAFSTSPDSVTAPPPVAVVPAPPADGPGAPPGTSLPRAADAPQGSTEPADAPARAAAPARGTSAPGVPAPSGAPSTKVGAARTVASTQAASDVTTTARVKDLRDIRPLD